MEPHHPLQGVMGDGVTLVCMSWLYRVGVDYALVTSSSYVDVHVGIEDRRVFEVPAECQRASRPMTAYQDVRRAAHLDY